MNQSPENPELVLAERRGSVLLLTLNRPDRLNAWTTPLENRYFELLDEAEADPEVRAIVLTGAGRGFCAGADMDDLNAGANEDAIVEAVGRLTRPRCFPRTIRKPLIAAVNGPAIGLGLVEALYCDVRFATPEAKLGTIFARRGLIAEYGISWLLPRIVGTGRALDLLLSARTILGEEAYRIGLVDQLASADTIVDAAVAYAEDFATNCSPTAMAVIKEQVLNDLDVDFDTAFARSDRLFMESFEREDVSEGVNSYLEKRPPRFPPLASA
jgi:enoyl-CoA hydratase/carnithine racemase